VAAAPTDATGQAPVVLDVRNLTTYFYTYDGVVRALEGVSFKLRRGETLGMVGETGCGKSVTAFSITRLIPEPPGRVVSGTVLFRGVNLLWGLDKEATFKPIKKTNRVKVRLKFRRVKAAQNRLSAVRGGGISMIFQEPGQAMNPIFSIADQVGEAVLLHQGVDLISGLLKASPSTSRPQPSRIQPSTPVAGPETPPAAGTAVVGPPSASDMAAKESRFRACAEQAADAAVAGDLPTLRKCSAELASIVGVPSFAQEAYYRSRELGASGGRERIITEIRKASRRFHLSGMQRSYLRGQLRMAQLDGELRAIHMDEMREGKLHRLRVRRNRGARTGIRLRTWWLGLPGIKRKARRPIQDEVFWRVVKALEGVQIANPVQIAKGYPFELSGGMVQRVMIAMALISNPDVLLADEPTTALDVTVQAQILELMRELRHRVGTAILLITHDLAVIAEVADRVAVMYAGQVVEMAPVRDLFTRPLHPYAQGLLASVPRMDQPTRHLSSIPGSVPNLLTPPTGCRFHPRCAFAMPICRESRPPLTDEGNAHHVACFLYHGPPVVV
jgi:peptide/nickel transport system ATP-binding protein